MFRVARAHNRLTLVPLAGLLVAAAALAGAVRAVWVSPGDGPFGGIPWVSGGQAQVQDPIVAERGLTQVEAPDRALEFPDRLRDLPASPYDLAADRSGAVWFVLFDGQADGNTLYRYDPASSTLKSFAIPESNGSGLDSELEVDERGHVIWAEGEMVLDFDPATGTYKEIRVAPSSNPASFIPPAGTFITAMDLDGSGHAYVSRMNVAAITEIELQTGKMRDIPYPADFGPIHDLAAADGVVWITNPYDMEAGPRAQAGRINVRTGAYSPIDGVPAIFAKGPGGKLYGTSFERGGLGVLDGDRLSATAPASVAVAGLGVPDGDVVVVDGTSGLVWASGTGVVLDIIKFDPLTKESQTYSLGSYVSNCIGPIPPPGQPDPCHTQSAVSPLISGMAVAPNGDLYFSDSAFNRIGVIRAGR